ncbi:MAG TPA: hypothetical protein VGR32_05390 [Brevundimonas sp.]|jgi:hypothetical protein|uniref:hypothetical protein n=1 Tax=Brevundimonas sp. TaxID=1871086 RepID=UPI002DE6CCBE|nr:hypothetical protein [Brevundimonas sp.]
MMRSLVERKSLATACLISVAALSLAACGGKTRHTFSGGGGYAGTPGAAGPEGPAGPQGPKGDPGAAGLPGMDGLPGMGGGSGGLLGGAGAVTIGDQTLVGTPGQTGPLGVSVLSPTQATGSVATVGALSGGQVVSVGTGAGTTATTSGGTPTGLLGVNVGGHQVLGQGGSNLIGVGVLSPNGQQGTNVTGNVLSGGQTVGVGVSGTQGSGSGHAGGVVGGVVGTVGGVLQPSNGGSHGQPGGTGPLPGGLGGLLRPR